MYPVSAQASGRRVGKPVAWFGSAFFTQGVLARQAGMPVVGVACARLLGRAARSVTRQQWGMRLAGVSFPAKSKERHSAGRPATARVQGLVRAAIPACHPPRRVALGRPSEDELLARLFAAVCSSPSLVMLSLFSAWAECFRAWGGHDRGGPHRIPSVGSVGRSPLRSRRPFAICSHARTAGDDALCLFALRRPSPTPPPLPSASLPTIATM